MDERMNEFDNSVMVFYQMLCNAFMDDDDRDMICEKVELTHKTNLNEIIVAMVAAIAVFCEKLDPETFGDQDLIGITHLLNRLVVQHLYMKDGEAET